MDTIKIMNRGNCKIVAHRGLSYLETENTIPAFIAAANRSYHAIETDVHVTSDGKIIVIHDSSTARVAAGRDVSVEENTFSLLRTVELADKEGRVGRIDLRMPSLAEYIDICRRYDKLSVLELKNHMPPSAIKTIVDEIRLQGMLDRVIFISFDLDNLKKLRELLPEQRLMYLTGDYTPQILDDLKKYRLDLDVYHGVVTADMVNELHSLGIRIGVWTCDDLSRADELIGMEIDYLTTNCLE